MGKLIDQERRAKAKAEKGERMRRIVAAATHAFEHQPFAEVSLDSIGRRAGVRQGLASMYFGSKEELYLSLVDSELREWSQQLEITLEGEVNEGCLGDTLAASLAERALLLRLLSQIHVVLEQTPDVSAAVAFQQNQEERLLALGARVAICHGRLSSHSAARLVYRVLLSAAGLRAVTGLLSPTEEVFRVELASELTSFVNALLAAAR